MGTQGTVPLVRGPEIGARPDAYLLIDVRTPGEFREGHISNSVNVPRGDVGRFAPTLKVRAAGRDVVLVCRTGKRATAALEQLSKEGLRNCQVLDGGIIAWAAEGLPVTHGGKAMSIERQVRIVAGALVALGTGLGAFLHPLFLLISGFVGMGLVVAGITDTCAMGLLLARMPWNRAGRVATCEGGSGNASAPEQQR
jgi:rhodanese-related sulfurtransferase